jgi:predicted phosphate transport protein (TIGR00153 family)
MMENIDRIVFRVVEEHARRINRSFKELAACINAWLVGNQEEVDKKINIISTLEKESSKLKKTLLAEIGQAQANLHRTDYIRLTLQMGEVSGYQGGAAVRLGKTVFHPKADDPMVNKFKALCDVFIQMGDALANSIKHLGENNLKALEYTSRIDEIEDQIDDTYRDLEAHLYSRSDLDIRLIMQIRTVALHIEEACDIVQRISDSVTIILSSQ